MLRFRKLASLLLSILMLFLCACSSDVLQNPSGNKGGNTFMPTGQKVASSIFGRNVKYNEWTPAVGITLPIDSSEILDTVQIEKAICFFTANGIYRLDLESGESGKLIDTAKRQY